MSSDSHNNIVDFSKYRDGFGKDHPEDGTYVELVFHHVSPDQILAVCTFSVPEKPGEIHLSDQLYRLRNYSDGSRDWESYSFNAKTWVSGAGDDVFDLSVLLAEHERYMRQQKGQET